MLGATGAAQRTKIEEATKSANDLSGLIKKKNKSEPEKRKLDDVEEAQEQESKKAKVEDA